MSATNPENGTVSYTYVTSGYAIGKVATRTDAKGQVATYSYDSLARLLKVQRYPSGTSYPADACQEEDYYYDGTTPSSSSTVTSSMGHLSAVQYWGGYNFYNVPTCDTTFTELYTYGTPGAPVTKELQATRTLQWSGVGWFPYTLSLSAGYTYDNEGRITNETYPTDNSGNTQDLSYTFDSMGRLNTMTDNIAMTTLIASASYGPANEMLSLTGGAPYWFGGYGGESRVYNSLKQLTSLSSGTYIAPLSITYNYPSTGNNGKIGSQYDSVSGETVTYAYDALNRLASATSSTSSWGQAFTYDGFGNLTGTSVTAGSAPTLAETYDVNNHAGGEDANGNPGGVLLPAYSVTATPAYDVENRLTSLYSGTLNPVPHYSYAPDNKRVWYGQLNTSGTLSIDEITFWSVTGQKLAVYDLTTISGLSSMPQFYATQNNYNLYFGGKLIQNANGWVYSDRLNSIGKFYPYGIERPSATTNGTEKFTGYFRDAESGNDYAVNRYDSPGYGRFLTPDPSWASARLENPQTWNRYTYALDDPVNNSDPLGLCAAMLAGVTMTPGGGDSNLAFGTLQGTLGAEAAYPYAGLGLSGSLASVASQALFGPNYSTAVAIGALEEALASTSAPIDVIAYSGGAQAFTTAFDELTPAQQARIGSILYISPGSVGDLAVTTVASNTTVELGNDLADYGATFFTQFSPGVNIVNTNCDHADLVCLFGNAQPQLSAIAADGPCSTDPMVFALGQRSYNLFGPPGPSGSGWGTGIGHALQFYNGASYGGTSGTSPVPDPTPVVTSTVTYNP